MRTFVKICGLTRPQDAAAAASLGADALGVVFAASPRRLTPDAAAMVLREAPEGVRRVGVFAGQSLGFVVEAVEACALDWVQLCGDEPVQFARRLPVPAIRVVHVNGEAALLALRKYPAAMFLLDAPPTGGQMGGLGRTFDWSSIDQLPWPRSRVLVAGGLTPGNVEEAILRLRPAGVDVSSGVESAAGIKDPERMRSFISAVRQTDARLSLTPVVQ